MFTCVISLFLFITTTLATGIFVNPAPNADGAVILATGNTIDISWTNTLDYDILSLGYYSTSNQTVTWLISNSQSNPTSFSWTVDASARGFQLSASRIFAFYIVKDLNFGDPFHSSWFIIDDNLNAGSTANAPTHTITVTSTISINTQASKTPSETSQLIGSQVTFTSTSASATVAGSDSSSHASASLSTGAVAGIAVGAVIAALAIAILLFIIFRQRKRLNKGEKQGDRPELAENQPPALATAIGPNSYNVTRQASDNPPRYELDRNMIPASSAAELGSERRQVNAAELPDTHHEQPKYGRW